MAGNGKALTTTGKRRSGASVAQDSRGRVAPFVPTPEQRKLVRNLAGIGCRNADILLCLDWGRPDGKPISEGTLLKHFRGELERGRAVADMQLRRRVYDLAMEGDRTLLIFLCKTRLGMKETIAVEQSGPNGEPLGPQAILYLPAKDSAPPPTLPQVSAQMVEQLPGATVAAVVTAKALPDDARRLGEGEGADAKKPRAPRDPHITGRF